MTSLVQQQDAESAAKTAAAKKDTMRIMGCVRFWESFGSDRCRSLAGTGRGHLEGAIGTGVLGAGTDGQHEAAASATATAAMASFMFDRVME